MRLADRKYQVSHLQPLGLPSLFIDDLDASRQIIGLECYVRRPEPSLN
jgi:hypothetical protein